MTFAMFRKMVEEMVKTTVAQKTTEWKRKTADFLRNLADDIDPDTKEPDAASS